MIAQLDEGGQGAGKEPRAQYWYKYTAVLLLLSCGFPTKSLYSCTLP